MSTVLSVAECRKLLGKSAEGMTDGRVEGLRDAMYGLSETLCDEIRNTDSNKIWHEAFMIRATEADIEDLLREDAQYADYLAAHETDDGPYGFPEYSDKRKPS